jgi:hypothetical protein
MFRVKLSEPFGYDLVVTASLVIEGPYDVLNLANCRQIIGAYGC